jgi:hypothetical protein
VKRAGERFLSPAGIRLLDQSFRRADLLKTNRRVEAGLCVAGTRARERPTASAKSEVALSPEPFCAGEFLAVPENLLMVRFRGQECPRPNPYLDAQGYKDYVAEREQAFVSELQKQTEAAHK